MAMSLDALVAGPQGEDSGLHDYFFSSDPATANLVADGIRAAGAIIMGRGAYDMGVQHGGFADDPYPVPHFVLTHNSPATPAPGAEAFVFVTDGFESALRQARAAAGDREIVIGGGPRVAQAFLQAGLVDEIALYLVPVLLGAGLRLFDGLGPKPVSLELLRLVQVPEVIYLRYRLAR
jgi:dihydrofolate reductase